MKQAFTIAAMIFVIAQITATAQEKKKTPLQEFGGTTHFHLMMCQIKARTAFSRVELGEIPEAQSPISACRTEAKDSVKVLFAPALAQVAKKPETSRLLKEYYAQWMTLLDGVSPDANERKISYERRQGEAARKLDEHWNRVAIEAGL